MVTVNVYGIRLIAKHSLYLAGEPFRLSLHRLLSPSAVPHVFGRPIYIFDICVYCSFQDVPLYVYQFIQTMKNNIINLLYRPSTCPVH